MRQAAAQAIGDVTRAYATEVRWGLLVFPSGQTACSVDTFPRTIPSPPEEIAATLRAVLPGGLTPASVALDDARIHLETVREVTSVMRVEGL